MKKIIVGVGSAGCNVLDKISKHRTKDVELYSFDTTLSSLMGNDTDRRFIMGKDTCNSLGCGGIPIIARKMLENPIYEVIGNDYTLSKAKMIKSEQLFEDADIVLFVMGLGGGTGTEASIVLAETARNLGCTIIIVPIMPFDMETRRVPIAKTALAKLYPLADMLVVFKNQTFLVPYPEKSIKEVMQLIDCFVANGVSNLIKIDHKVFEVAK